MDFARNPLYVPIETIELVQTFLKKKFLSPKKIQCLYMYIFCKKKLSVDGSLAISIFSTR